MNKIHWAKSLNNFKNKIFEESIFQVAKQKQAFIGCLIKTSSMFSMDLTETLRKHIELAEK